MKRILLLSAFCLQIVIVQAQSHYQDVIFQKGGNVYRGTILDGTDSTTKIEIAGGSVFNIQKKGIDSVKLEKLKPVDATIFRQNDFGYFNITEIGITAGTRPTDYNYAQTHLVRGFSVQTINGYRFRSHFLIGAGIAADADDHTMLRLFGDVRYELNNHQVTPYAYANYGYAIDLTANSDNDYEQIKYAGGLAAVAGVGMRFNFNNHGAFLIDAGYKTSKRREEISFTGEPMTGDATTVQRYTNRRLFVNAGLAF